MSSEIVYIDTYLCPHCRAELEAGFDKWQGWLRCPGCGLPSLPPELARLRAPRRMGAAATVADDVLIISDSPDRHMSTDLRMPSAAGKFSQMSPTRLVFRTGLLVSLALAFVAFLDHKTTNMTIFGVLAVGFFLLLLRKPGTRPPTS